MQRYVYQGGRGGGKTYALMTEIHEHIVSGSRQSILVVLLDMDQVRWFHDTWAGRFPSLPRPDYCTLGNRLRVSGRRYEHIYVENVEHLDDGIDDERFDVLLATLPLDGSGTVTFTSGWNDLSGYSHRRVTTPSDLIARFKRAKRN